MILHDLSLVLIGFSLPGTLLLSVVMGGIRDPRGALVAVSLACLFILQINHFEIIRAGISPWRYFAGDYFLALWAVTPALYFYASRLLSSSFSVGPAQAIHLLPPIVAPVVAVLVPQIAQQIFLGAFIFGIMYLTHMARALWVLRDRRYLFVPEFAVAVVLLGVACGVVVLGFSAGLMYAPLFFPAYSSAIGLGIFLVLYIRLRYPHWPDLFQEIASVRGVSTLGSVDVDDALARLSALMIDAKIYADESLDLAGLAVYLHLSRHQTSELINTHLGMGFSRLLRERRINAAKVDLIKDPDASVLAIGLEVGFSSQSAFYAAFKEQVGMAPGQYRKERLKPGVES